MFSTKFRLFLNLAITCLGVYWINQNPDNWSGYVAFFYGTIISFYCFLKLQKKINNTPKLD